MCTKAKKAPFFWTVHGPFLSGLRAALTGGWPPMHACGRSLWARPKENGGKQAKRRQRRKQRACFEEAARLAAPTGPGIVLPRRWFAIPPTMVGTSRRPDRCNPSRGPRNFPRRVRRTSPRPSPHPRRGTGDFPCRSGVFFMPKTGQSPLQFVSFLLNYTLRIENHPSGG